MQICSCADLMLIRAGKSGYVAVPVNAKMQSRDIVYDQIRFLFSLSINNGLPDETGGRILAENRHCFIHFCANIYDMSI